MIKKTLLLQLIIFISAVVYSQNDTSYAVQQQILKQYADAKIDSLLKAEIKEQLLEVKLNSKEKSELEKRLQVFEIKDSISKISRSKKMLELKRVSKPYPVILFNDTLFSIYTKVGSFNAKTRAETITKRINNLYDNGSFIGDSISLIKNESSYDITYNGEMIIMAITDLDAFILNQNSNQLANNYKAKIKETIIKYKELNSFSNLMKRIAEIILIILCLGLIIYLINRLFKRSKGYLIQNQDRFLNGISIRKFKLFTVVKHREYALKANNILRLSIIALTVYLSLPLMFSVFPTTKSYTNTLINWITLPAKSFLKGIFDFTPNLVTIIVIFFITRWAIKAINYFFKEIENGDIHFAGFHKDWAIPTFNILKFLLYAFMLVVIFPYLPGSGSPAFQGVSVFLGILISLGSSSAITNIIAGLVITYMRPFKIGDRVKIGEVVGDVIEKTMLVTRIRTIKNEDITVPNSAVLSSHTINYSSVAKEKGLIVHTTVTIGYDVPWKNIHQALIDASLRTEFILTDPQPFVLQTSLDDFYVSYQINAYTREANKQAIIYSNLHQNIQDCCNEVGIEILSPHYRAGRDGNATTIPENYLSKDYKAPSFNVNINNK